MKNDELEPGVGEYLIDPASPPAAEVVRYEEALRELRYHPRFLELPARRRTASLRFVRWALAAGLSVALVLSVLSAWRLTWPEGRAWVVEATSGRSQLVPGGWLSLESGEEAVVRVARIGRMSVAPDSRLRLLATGTQRHRLALDQGSVAVSVWSPPMRLAIATPAGWVYDMGCAFRLDVRGETAAVEVTSGWVQLENGWGEVLVPEGALSEMRSDRAPAVPLFVDAPERFRAAVRSFEREPSAPAVRAMVADARARDVLTLLLLAVRADAGRDQLLARAAELARPPSPQTYTRAVGGDTRAVWEWVDTLDLPPPKGWRRNWRDGFRGPPRQGGDTQATT